MAVEVTAAVVMVVVAVVVVVVVIVRVAAVAQGGGRSAGGGGGAAGGSVARARITLISANLPPAYRFGRGHGGGPRVVGRGTVPIIGGGALLLVHVALETAPRRIVVRNLGPRPDLQLAVVVLALGPRLRHRKRIPTLPLHGGWRAGPLASRCHEAPDE